MAKNRYPLWRVLHLHHSIVYCTHPEAILRVLLYHSCNSRLVRIFLVVNVCTLTSPPVLCCWCHIYMSQDLGKYKAILAVIHIQFLCSSGLATTSGRAGSFGASIASAAGCGTRF